MNSFAPAGPSTGIRLDSARGRWIIVATALGSGMIFLDGTVVNVALPRIQTELAAPLSGLQWIVNSYTLFLAALLMLGGSIGDIYGRKTAFLSGLTLFTLASVACGLAPNLNALIAARAVQGIGGALLVPGSLAMIKAIIAPEDSGRAIGLWAGLSGVTTAAGPLLGGYLVDAVSWRTIFFINIPFALITYYATWAHVPANRDESAAAHLDLPGAAMTTLGLGGLTYALIEGPNSGWGAPLVIAAMVFGVIGVVLFPLRELRARHPMVPLAIFRSRTFDGANIATLGVYFAFSGAFLFLVLDLQQVQGYSPLEAGASLLPVTLLLLLLSPRVGGLMNRFGARAFMTGGPVLIAVGFLLLALTGTHVNYWTGLLPGILVFGTGMSLFITPLTATVMNAVPPQQVGVASGISNTLTRIASLLAVAVLGIIISARFDSVLKSKAAAAGLDSRARTTLSAHSNRLADDPIPAGLSAVQRRVARSAINDAFVDGFRWDMWTCAALCLASGLVCFATVRREDEFAA